MSPSSRAMVMRGMPSRCPRPVYLLACEQLLRHSFTTGPRQQASDSSPTKRLYLLVTIRYSCPNMHYRIVLGYHTSVDFLTKKGKTKVSYMAPPATQIKTTQPTRGLDITPVYSLESSSERMWTSQGLVLLLINPNPADTKLRSPPSLTLFSKLIEQSPLNSSSPVFSTVQPCSSEKTTITCVVVSTVSFFILILLVQRMSQGLQHGVLTLPHSHTLSTCSV